MNLKRISDSKESKKKVKDSQSLAEQVTDELTGMAEAGTVGPDDIEGLGVEFGIDSEDWPDVVVSAEDTSETFNGEDDDFYDKVLDFVKRNLKVGDTKKVKDSDGYPETLQELQNWGPSARDILEEFDQWADRDLLIDVTDSLIREFDLDAVEGTVCELIDNNMEGSEQKVLESLDQILSVDQLNEFISDYDRMYDFSDIK